jgi:2-polyprenyl-3-methyl-5-hydroxy-6-metoxy-1,4-benzoquinol methylase
VVSGSGLPPVVEQRRFWNAWNATHRSDAALLDLDPATLRRRDTVIGWLGSLGLRSPRILDVGCATGWLTVQLAQFGAATGTDIADDSIRVAESKGSGITFIAGDFLQLEFAADSFDVVVCVETLSHVPDQREFMERIAMILRPGGYLILTTQNRFVFERRTDVAPQAAGQIRRWVTRRELRRLVAGLFKVRQLTTLLPVGHLGVLRLLNSIKLRRALEVIQLRDSFERAKERAGLGQTIALLAQRV